MLKQIPLRTLAARHRLALPAACALVIAAFSPLAGANNVGENAAWQFQTSADKVNQAAVQDMIQKRRSGYYAAPVYNTHIDRQYNCTLGATSTGNEGSNSTVANSPGTQGAQADAAGNSNSTDVSSGRNGASNIGNTQGNAGAVGSGVWGATQSAVNGYATQALNSTQANSGSQYASVTGSTGCSFGALN